MKAFTLESALGFSVKAEHKGGASLQKVALEGNELQKAFRHWQGLGEEERPPLRSLVLAPGPNEAPALNLVFDLGGDQPYLCVCVPVKDRLPDFSALWPYCAWWQEELSLFSGLKFGEAARNAGVNWRQI
jgi:hypothetical protein